MQRKIKKEKTTLIPMILALKGTQEIIDIIINTDM